MREASRLIEALRPTAYLLLAILATACSDLFGEPRIKPLARLQLDSTRTVEVVGLRRWTVEMIQDSLRKYAPEQTLDSHTCAAALREKLHFADAMSAEFVHMTVDGADTTERTTVVLSVREPGDSARVKYIAFDAEERALRPEWVRLTSAYTDSLAEFRRAYYTFLAMSPAERESHDSAGAGTLLRELLSRTTHSDFNAALSTLMASPSAPDRAVAALLLTHFPERADTWHTLLQASMAQHQWLDAGIAAEALAWLGRYRAIEVSWDPVAAEINNALDGTALPAFRAIGYALLTTRAANRGNANAFLKGGGEMLTAYLESSVQEYSRLAHELLKGLRGADLGTNPGPWRSWIAGM